MVRFMDMVPVRYVLIGINTLSTLLSAYASIASWRRREKAGLAGIYLAISMAATTIYAFGYTMELASDTLQQILFWIKIEHLGVQFIAFPFLFFTLCLSGRQKLIKPQFVVFFSVFALVLIASAWTNQMHLEPHLTPGAPFPTLSYTRGLWTWLSIGNVSFCLVLSIATFISMSLHAVSTFRKQMLMFILGSLLPLAGMIITATSRVAYSLDLAPLALSVSGILFIIGITRFQIFDIIPLARDMIFENMDNGFVVFDSQERLVDFNLRAQKILPEIGDQSVGIAANRIFCSRSSLLELIQRGSGETINLQKGNAIYRCRMLPLSNPQDKLIGKVVTLENYTEVDAMVKQLKELATMDPLTGIYNRRYFYEVAKKEIARSIRLKKQLSLILFDLDNLKFINDSLGHSAGDEVLKFVVRLVLQRLRKYDIFGRFGGDEFLILLPETDISAAKGLADELRASMESSKIPLEDRTVQTTGSFGVADILRDHPMPLEDLLSRADKAVYVAKDGGRNRVCIEKANLAGS